MEISQRIIDYTIWYYLRYYPSPNKLRFKLKLKFWVESEKWKKYGWIGIDENRIYTKWKTKKYKSRRSYKIKNN